MRILRGFLRVLVPMALLGGMALAQDAPDPSVPGGVDAQDLLGSRAKEPDIASTPSGIQQGDNAGSMSVTVPAENMTTTHTETRSSSSSFSVSTPSDSGAGSTGGSLVPQLGTTPPPWMHKHHANQGAAGGVVPISPGPIWNNGDAKNKCPAICGKAGMSWNGDWRTTGPNQSECDCLNAGGQQAMAGGRGTSCSAPQNYQCRGCSVSCPAGLQAHCTTGDRGIFTGDNAAICATDAKCECK